MTELNSWRALPPLSPKPAASDNENDNQTVKKHKRKKSARSRSANSPDGHHKHHSKHHKKHNNKHHNKHHNKHEIDEDTAHSKSGHGDQDNLDATIQKEQVPKAKKKKKPPSASREELMSGDEILYDRSSTEPQTTAHKKHKKHKKKKIAVTSETEEDEDALGLAADLGDLKEDVVVTDQNEQSMQEEMVWAQPTMRSEPISKVFIEQRTGFRTADKQKLARRREDEAARSRDAALAPPRGLMSTTQMALNTHVVFRRLALLFQGLFAGIALWQIVSVFVLFSFGNAAFLEHYHKLAQPVQSIYFLLFTFCTVAMFDKYDVGRPTARMLQQAFTLQSGAVVCVIYVLGLFFSLFLAATDNKISLYKYEPLLWEDEEERDKELQTWKILNLLRGLFVILSWLILGLATSTPADRLSKNLIKADENLLLQDSPINVGNVAATATGPNGV